MAGSHRQPKHCRAEDGAGAIEEERPGCGFDCHGVRRYAGGLGAVGGRVEPVEFDSGKAVAPKLGEERPKSPKQEVTLHEGVELVDVDGGASPSTSA
ncbi:hypothetical protein [Mycoplana rhizolycopersici]|uniref:Uncharacterized protein n=1 Tax=Mycoplana rhizolycopersici TaxID=2746702 RepID=A0ABX2QBB6_9HYPH|nr:hypothetical protein [Rhizobium rhizolycopersici]NVP54641.1 hypothetical protein [Rhizobium rhizolycopersici]